MRMLEDKVALVTGASRGIGFAIAESLASAGATVVLNGRNQERLSQAVDALRAKGYAADSALFDASDEVVVDRSVQEIADRHRRLDILVNNAGVVLSKDIFETTLQEWNSVLSNNLNSAFLCSRAALQVMHEKKNGGRIIMIGSTAGQRGAPAGAVAYSASKAGLTGLAQTLAFTSAPYGVTVNVVAPGMIRTEMLSKGFGPGFEEVAQKAPFGLGEPNDVAHAVLFLAGDSGRYVTGATLDVNGGLYHR
jgi:NAD(P)-dependent dehydrogenase (short-subunit alcohol dehydrogenase family)